MLNPTPTDSSSVESLLSVGAVVRLTGLSEHVLRAWERRYGAVVPVRTSGGTRRYRESDVVRLRLLRDAIAAGNRIGYLAGLDDNSLRGLCGRSESSEATVSGGVREALVALNDLDFDRAKAIVAMQLAALGPCSFAKDFVTPLMREVGTAWEQQDLAIASEHLGSTLIRSALESALRAGTGPSSGPVVLFATPPGEHHEIGLLVAAIVAQTSGARVLYLGSDLPVEEIVSAVDRGGAQAVALSAVTLSPEAATQTAQSLREKLSAGVDLWMGGAAATPETSGISHIASLEELEVRIMGLRSLAKQEAR